MEPVSDLTLAGTWLSDPSVQKMLAVLNTGGEEAYIVGGAVRDALLNRPAEAADIDVATTALPEVSLARMEAAGFKVMPTGIRHGTILAVADKSKFEITTLRRDVETDGRHAMVAFGRCFVVDASRRDFTMNALYCDAAGAIYDPIHGLQDCLDGRVRFIGDPDRRLEEDYLRLLRFFRFTSDFGAGRPDPAGLAACIRARTGLGRLSVERIAQETRKLLLSENAAAVCRVFAASGLAQPTFGAAPNPALFAGLVDLARRYSRPLRFETALAAYLVHGVDDGASLALRLKLSNAETKFLQTISRLGLVRWRKCLPDETDLAHAAVSFGREAAEQAFLIAASRLHSRTATDRLERSMAFVSTYDPPDFPLKGRDLRDLGLKTGPRIGVLLERARSAWRDEGYLPTRQSLLERVRRWIGES